MERSENWKESWISFRELQKDGSLQEVQQLLKQLVKESLEEKNRYGWCGCLEINLYVFNSLAYITFVSITLLKLVKPSQVSDI